MGSELKRDWIQWLADQDQRIRSAQGDKVKAELRRLNLKQVPRRHILALANLARRLNLSALVLRLIYPLMDPESASKPEASQQEQALYALALARLGAYQESSDIFEHLDGADKQIQIYRASALVSQWNYKKAHGIYRQLLRRRDLTESEVLIARINLVSCSIFLGNYQLALELLVHFNEIKDSYPLLYGNSLELKAQAYFFTGDYERAEEFASQSIKFFGEGETDYSLFAKKWLVMIQGMKTGQPPQDWEALRKTALEHRDFETCRDLDLLEACLRRDQSLFLKVYFGTSSVSYRQQALKRFRALTGLINKMPLAFATKPDVGTELDLETGSFNLQLDFESFTTLQLKLLRALSSDLYRPLLEGELFSVLYPDEKFDIYTSPHRLFQSVQNLRKTLLRQEVSLRIVFDKGCYSLVSEAVSLRLKLRYKRTSPSPSCLEKLKGWLLARGHRPFRRKDLEVELQISKNEAVKWLKLGQADKLITQMGGGNNFIYHPRSRTG